VGARQFAWFLVLAVVAAVFSELPSQSEAQRRYQFDGGAPIPDEAVPGAIGAPISASTSTIVSGTINSAWLTTACDWSALLDDANNFRVLPVIGNGGAQDQGDVVNLATDVPGRKWFPEVRAWLDKHRLVAGAQADFNSFLARQAVGLSAAQFLKWNEERQREQTIGQNTRD
jgi:hypothetical protein